MAVELGVTVQVLSDYRQALYDMSAYVQRCCIRTQNMESVSRFGHL